MGAVILTGSVPDCIGYGNGYGYGYGYGNGYGYGDGYGNGYGYGYGDGDYWKATIPYFAAKWPATQRLRLAYLEAAGAIIAFWKSDASGRACNNGGARHEPVTVGKIETVTGPLEICTKRALHATTIPPKYNGDRLWIVAMIGETQWREDKCGALTREIIGECL